MYHVSSLSFSRPTSEQLARIRVDDKAEAARGQFVPVWTMSIMSMESPLQYWHFYSILRAALQVDTCRIEI